MDSRDAIIRWIDVLAVGALLFAGFCLYFASRPSPGAMTTVAEANEEEIQLEEERRKRKSRLGFALLTAGILVQVLRLVGILR